MADGRWRRIRQGESIDSISLGTGHLPDTIWNATENRDLAQLRKTPHQLFPGDRVFIPPVAPRVTTVATGQRHTFKRKGIVTRLKLRLLRKGKPRAGESFVLTVDDKDTPGSLDGDGNLDLPIPVGARRATLTVGEGDQQTVHKLQLRGLDPSGESSGVQARLRNLGFDVGAVDGNAGLRTARALMHFQIAHDLPATGAADEKTMAKLIEVHGS